jgi:hypothetical protein
MEGGARSASYSRDILTQRATGENHKVLVDGRARRCAELAHVLFPISHRREHNTAARCRRRTAVLAAIDARKRVVFLYAKKSLGFG